MASSKDIGAWEKHTKGFALKYLQKFGFKGRLGANENGVSAAVEVVVRPTNVGLGFGDTVEAANLLVNKKIEAEWKGVEFQDRTKASDIEKMSDRNKWKKGIYTKNHRGALSANDFLDTVEKNVKTRAMFVVDMRHNQNGVVTEIGSINSETSMKNGCKVKLGSELLYNVDLIANIEEVEVTDLSRRLTSDLLRGEHLCVEIDAQSETAKIEYRRTTRLETIVEILSGSNVSSASFLAVVDQFLLLHESCPEEFEIFDLMKLLRHQLGNVIHLRQWKPSEPHASDMFFELVQSRAKLVDHFERHNLPDLARRTYSVMSSIVERHVLPQLRRFVVNEWQECDMLSTIGVGLAFFRHLQTLLSASSFSQTMDMVILPRFVSAVSSCKLGSENLSLSSLFAAWLPLLGQSGQNLKTEIHRKLCGYLASASWSPASSADWALKELSAWRLVCENPADFDRILESQVGPKLAQVLRNFSVDPAHQSLRGFEAVMIWIDLMPVVHSECLFLGEFFPKWLRVLSSWLQLQSVCLSEVVKWLQGWRSMFSPALLVRSPSLLAPFNLALDMIEARFATLHSASQSENYTGFLDQFHSVLVRLESSTYHSLLESGRLHALASTRLDVLTSQSGSHLNFANNLSFKEVLETCAERNGIVFVPRLGKNVDDKQVYQFGSSAVYIDERVVFALDSQSQMWRPITLEDLLQSANCGFV